MQPSDKFYLAILYKVGAKLFAAGVAKEDWAGALVGPIELRSTSITSSNFGHRTTRETANPQNIASQCSKLSMTGELGLAPVVWLLFEQVAACSHTCQPRSKMRE